MKENEKNSAAQPRMEANRPNRPYAEDNIDLVELLYVLIGHVWQIIVAAVLCAALAFSYTYFMVTPQYTTTAKMYLVSASNDSLINLSDLQLGSNLKEDYRTLLKSRPLLEDVITSLGLARSSGQLYNMITIYNPADTRILYVTVSSPNPKEAADIANELVNQAKIYLPEIMKIDEPSFYEPALIPSSKSSPSYSRNTMLGALAGGALCAGVFIVQFLLNDTLVTPDDVTKYLGVQSLAIIPEANMQPDRSKRSQSTKKGKEVRR